MREEALNADCQVLEQHSIFRYGWHREALNPRFDHFDGQYFLFASPNDDETQLPVKRTLLIGNAVPTSTEAAHIAGELKAIHGK
jgi:hypothetical protein